MSALSTALHCSDHIAHFYRTEESFSDAVGDFCARALESGQPLLLVAPPDHRDGIRRGLVMRGLDWDGAVRLGRLECYNALQVLDAFLANGMTDERLFLEQLDPMLNGVAGRFGPGTTIRVFGEMVDLLIGK